MDTLHDKVHFFTIFVFPFEYFSGGNSRKQPKQMILPSEAGQLLIDESKNQKENGWTKSLFSVGDKARHLDYGKLQKLLADQITDQGSEERTQELHEKKDQARLQLSDLIWDYNEWYYFHPYVRKMIYETPVSESEEIEFLTRKDFTTLCVQLDEGGGPPLHVSTEVKSIDLHLYANGIGLLSITTESERRSTFEQMLRYNDAARRVYPPFLGWSEDTKSVTSAPRANGCLPNVITLVGKPSLVQHIWDDLPLPPIEQPFSDIIKHLLRPFQLAPLHEQQCVKGTPYFGPFTDDRMFIVSYCAYEELASRLSKKCCGHFEYESSPEWYRFLFVDGRAPGEANAEMRRELLRKHTYERWAERGTLFGMSRYSFVMLADEGWFSKNILYNHMKRQYYQLAVLVLFQRAMLLRFSQQIKNLTSYSGRNIDYRRASELHFDFIRFTNRYWHSEVTPQEQGIELYNQWTRLVEHDRLYEDVKEEIAGLAEYLRSQTGHDTEQEIAKLTRYVFWLTVLLLVLTAWVTFFERQIPWPLDQWDLSHILFPVLGFTFVISLVLFLLPQRCRDALARLPVVRSLIKLWTKRRADHEYHT